jgi:hypothetical protein
VWLRGRTSGRYALVLSFAAAGQSLDDSLTVGTQTDAELVFYPAAVPLRALVATRHEEVRPGPPAGRTGGGGAAGLVGQGARRGSLAGQLARRPDRHPGPAPGPCLFDASGDALPLHPGAGDCWTLFALSGGRPLTVAGEWTPRGLWPLTAWDEGGMAVPL